MLVNPSNVCSVRSIHRSDKAKVRTEHTIIWNMINGGDYTFTCKSRDEAHKLLTDYENHVYRHVRIGRPQIGTF